MCSSIEEILNINKNGRKQHKRIIDGSAVRETIRILNRNKIQKRWAGTRTIAKELKQRNIFCSHNLVYKVVKK